MAGIRRALFWATLSKGLIAAVNLITTAVMARLLTPHEFGIAVLGMAVYTVAESLRELGGGAYLIQNQDLTHEQIRATFTINLLITVVIVIPLILLSSQFARFYGSLELEEYLKVVVLWFSIGPFFYPVLALMTREFAFGRVAIINITISLVGSAATIVFAIFGYSFMSYAWGSLLSGICGTLLGLYLWRDLSIFRPLLRGWFKVLEFSAFDSATAVLLSIWDSIPYFVLARFLNADAIGTVQRAYLISRYPERLIMAGVGAVSLPAFSKQLRDGQDIKAGYFTAIEHITGLQWPALVVLALLAHPVVVVVLGSRWMETVPLIRIMCAALLFYFPIGLNSPLLIALGAIRLLPMLVILQAAFSTLILWLAAPYGLQIATLTMFVTVPINVIMSMLLVRFYIPFSWIELVRAMRKSAAITLCSALLPTMIIALSRDRFDLPVATGVVAGCLAGLGWLAGIWLTNHPLQRELVRLVERFTSGIARLSKAANLEQSKLDR